MVTKRDLLFGLSAAGLAAAVGGSPAGATDGSEADALAAIMTWLNALQTGDPAVVDTVLAPEFQILRSDGSGYVRAGYLKALPKQTSKPVVSDIVATANGDILVARYVAEIEQTIDGKPVQMKAPRISVFRKNGDGWLILAHANFARIG